MALLLASLLCVGAAYASDSTESHAKYPNFPSDMPAHFDPSTQHFNYIRREVMIPMRDGVKLHTVILIPKGVKHAGIVLTRTPYDADRMTSGNSDDLGEVLQHDDDSTAVLIEDHYIRVVQDVRGKYGSEGDYVMNRPVLGPQNPTPVSDATDAYDTIDWLVKHVPESNGKVAIMGISYDGFEPLMALVHPHPALKVAIPENPMVDGWMGDDWFHHGAFREQMIPYIYDQTATRSNSIHWWSSYHDDYNMYLDAGNPTAIADTHGMQQLGFWNKLVAHPAYDAFWQDQAMDKILAAQPLKVPVMLVAGEWDQEDIYGPLAVYRALKPKDTHGDMVYLTLGPWYHGQEIRDGSALGPIKFNSDTSLYFREHILRPFLAHYLKDDAPPNPVAPVNAFVTGTNQWEAFSSWPGCASDCHIQSKPLYLQADHALSFTASAANSGDGYDEYISDPAKPVPYRHRPIPAAETPTWHEWLVDDQREAETRPDVETYETPVLTQAVRITGRPEVHLVASTSGTDSDWVVKLIDVYPQQDITEPSMSGYELAVGMDIFRGRYRTSYAHPSPLTPNVPLAYHFHLPAADHVFLPGHRIMVQIQSSWFPLYDRNPQTYVPNIFLAKPGDYRKAVQRIYHTPDHATYIDLPVAQ
ncbi:CocE/NonD family hydrolase [Dyella sp.]|uniref:CocE/NonD family hydrolase n=1 Tax=Dyella sp. TaxID=1869338 RepID=UPI0039C89E75